MKIIKSLLFVILLLEYPLICYASSLSVAISLDKKNMDLVHDESRLIVTTTITNNSNEVQKFAYMTCSYSNSWIPSREEILLEPENCRSNYGHEIILGPRKVYEGSLLIAITSKAKPGLLTFQLGFSRKILSRGVRIGFDSKHDMLKGIIWSNDLTVNVAPQMLPYLAQVPDGVLRDSRDVFNSLLK